MALAVDAIGEFDWGKIVRRILLSGAAVAALLATPFSGFAADAPIAVKAPPVAAAPIFNWSGFYVGGTVGYGWGDYTPFDTTPPIANGVNIPVRNVLGGGTVGFNWQSANLVFGIEADISNGPDGSRPIGTVVPGLWACLTGPCNVNIEYFGTIRGRLGLALDRWLLYATGGFAFGHAEGGIRNSIQQGGGSANGWAAGVGIERAYQPNWFLKFEYIHVDLGDLPFGIDGDGGRFLGRGDFDVVRLGVNYRFESR